MTPSRPMLAEQQQADPGNTQVIAGLGTLLAAAAAYIAKLKHTLKKREKGLSKQEFEEYCGHMDRRLEMMDRHRREDYKSLLDQLAIMERILAGLRRPH